MSYILDALRRADAERERDPARGIHAQPAAGAPVRARPRFPMWTWPVAGAIVLAGGFALWPRGAPVASVPPSPGLAKLPAPAPVVVPVATVVSPPAPAPLPAPVVERPVAKVEVAAAPSRVPAAPVAAAPTTAAVAAPTPAAAPAADRVYAFAELPADVQRELPKLAITGGVHSENAAQRLLIVGGQVMGEGAELAPGVLLEQIRPRSAVLKFRGWRYSVTY